MKTNIIPLQQTTKKYVGVKELATYLDVNENTIRAWLWQRRIPYFKIGRLVKFDLQEIETLIQGKKINIMDKY